MITQVSQDTIYTAGHYFTSPNSSTGSCNIYGNNCSS